MEFNDFEWDDFNFDHATMRFSADEMEDVLDLPFVTLRNKNDRPGSYRLVGRGRSGRLITLVLAPGSRPGSWRVITAWPPNPFEERHARRRGI